MSDQLCLPDIARRLFVQGLLSLGGVSVLSTKLGAETVDLSHSTWSLADSHVSSNGISLVSNHAGGSNLLIWDDLGRLKVEIRSEGQIFTPFVGRSGSVLFVERFRGNDANFKLYKAELKHGSVKIYLLKETREFVGFPIEIRNSPNGSIAFISGSFIHEAQGNPVPDRSVEVIDNEGRNTYSYAGFSSIGRLAQVGNQTFIAASGLNQKLNGIVSDDFGTALPTNLGMQLFSVSIGPEGISLERIQTQINSSRTLLGVGLSEIDEKFPILSVSFPNSGGRELSISCVDFVTGETNFDFILPSGADIGPPTLFLNGKSNAEVALMASERNLVGRTTVNIWKLDLVNARLARLPLAMDQSDSILILEI